MEGRRDCFTLEYLCYSLTERRWFLMRATGFRHGEQLRVVVAHENITERTLADEALRESEARDHTLVGVSPQAEWGAQPGGRITYCNPYWLDYTGLTLAQTVAEGWEQAVQP